ncbi:MAG: MFS transporter [Methanomassiliicoccales archaeon]|nr:MFS transporter [Methanomassiliicoccales archaeon]
MTKNGLLQGYMGKVMLVACIGSLMGTLDSTIVSVSLPTIAQDLGMDGASALWVPAAYLVTMAVLLLTIGRYSDMYGRKLVFIAGFTIFTLGSLLCAMASTGEELVAFRVLQGVGGAFITATSTAIITNTVPPSMRGRALGINTMSIYVGLSLGPALGGILTDAFGWRSIFMVNLPIGLIVVSLSLLWLKETGTMQERKPFDITGAMTFSLALVSLMVALTIGGKEGWDHPLALVLLAVTFIFMPIFLIIERRKRATAMFDLSLVISNRLFAAANVSAFLNYLAYYNVSFMMAFYMQNVLDMSILSTGFILLVMPVTMAVISPISGRMSDRLGSRTLATGGMLMVAIGLLSMLTLDLDSSQSYIAFLLFILGLGMGLFSTPNTSAVMGCVKRTQLGLASGTISLMRIVGMSLSLVVMGMAISVFGSPEVMNALSGGTGMELDPLVFLTGMRASLIISAVISLIGVFTSSLRPSGCPSEGASVSP